MRSPSSRRRPARNAPGPRPQAVIDAGEQFFFSDGGRTVNFRSAPGNNIEQNMNDLAAAIEDAGLNLKLVRPSIAEMAMLAQANQKPMSVLKLLG